MRSFLRSDRSRLVGAWLFIVAALVFGMVVVGGATRLTGSGLSITQWKPVTGVIPPMSQAAWMAEFQRYQQIPQYQLLNRGMSLDAFKGIYWWEWTHRLIGRLLGVVFAGPFIAFLAVGAMPRRLIGRCLVLFFLGGLQGFVGWWMVRSGLEARVSVAPERLATHLGLALILYCALIWTGWEAWSGSQRPPRPTRWAPIAAAIAGLVYLQSLLGALVAGNQAGLVDNDWPLMRGRVFPEDYWSGGLWRTLLHSQAAVQFNHRIIAYLLFALAVGTAIAAARARRAAGAVRGLAVTLGVLVTAQVSLGIATLMARAPLSLSIAHQAGAAIVLATAITFAWRAQRT
ncbi:MAG: COX15/CtaA family protein [Caulobacteraceae bacterium]|nr:COX15/CtaA family protein [Caulobacteraceae bacterium]